jgi:hypothetical protein
VAIIDEGDDVRAILQFVSVELLEMRYLDRRLDDALDRSYQALSRQRRRALRVAEWNAGILHKLRTLESIYNKMADQATN